MLALARALSLQGPLLISGSPQVWMIYCQDPPADNWLYLSAACEVVHGAPGEDYG